MTAGAVSAAGLMELEALREPLVSIPGPLRVDAPDPGKPQTIMALGTDGRLGADAGGGERSDTILLARLDPGNQTITMTSIPRDLVAEIPGHGTQKINAAYEYGGAALTLETVKNLLSTPEQPFRVHHVVEVNFTGFRELVDFLGCTYVDIDRDYFNDVSGSLGYAVIDIDPGYQQLCGEDALAYVRYRHTDSDFARAARQQDFLRQMLRQPGVESQLTFGNRAQLVKLAGKYLRTDRDLADSSKQLLSLLKLGLGVASKPIQQIPFGVGDLQYTQDFGSLIANPAALATTVERFLRPPKVGEQPRRKRPKRPRRPAGTLADLETAGAEQARALGRAGLRVYYPRLGLEGAEYEDAARAYRVGGGPAYRMVAEVPDKLGAYYGIQGMKWQDPPLLAVPHETVGVDGKRLDVYTDGGKTRLVAWRTRKAVYYVHNTVERLLTRAELLGIAASLTDLREQE